MRRSRTDHWRVSEVVIVDDDPDVRTSLSGLINSVGLSANSYASVSELLQSGPSPQASCLILDVRLPERSGLEWYEELAREGWRLPVIFISGYADVPMSVRAMKAGAFEFLTKPFRAQDLIDALQRAVVHASADRDKQEKIEALRRRFTSLSSREREVMTLVAKGLRNKTIAGRLSLSEATVKLHRGRLMRKMNATSIADLVRMFDKLEVGNLAKHR